jgi:hypothetical protein
MYSNLGFSASKVRDKELDNRSSIASKDSGLFIRQHMADPVQKRMEHA